MYPQVKMPVNASDHMEPAGRVTCESIPVVRMAWRSWSHGVLSSIARPESDSEIVLDIGGVVRKRSAHPIGLERADAKPMV
jgi:hypothetical protein